MLGSEPLSLGIVQISFTALAWAGGSKDLTENFTNAFFIGRRPVESRFLKPRTFMITLYGSIARLGISNRTGGMECIIIYC